MLLFFIFIISPTITEGRVFCQDTHATPWTGLGSPCPITCNTIYTAIERLKEVDYQILINGLINSTKMATKQNLRSNVSNSEGVIDLYMKTYEAFSKVIENEHFEADFNGEWQYLASTLNMTCYRIIGYDLSLRKVLEKCNRNQRKGVILSRYNKFLNKHGDEDNTFDFMMTLLVLKIVIDSPTFPDGKPNAQSILMILKRKCDNNHQAVTSEVTLTLESKHCLTTYVSGCYCLRGFVEKEGACVRPESCYTNMVVTQYLKRIILV
ncbi:uncharacterized protein LOC142985375 [Anticarsia gemmatalis]|uniref:uncharacterized protein LOC142985375 n=1 Tax=Anticarsia gemmatalis TaxID=129554 RepID=UPI003F770ACF